MNPRVFVVALLNSGLTGTLAYTVKDNTGNILVPRTLSGISESGSSAIYEITVPNWTDTWQGIITYDVSGTVLAKEDFTANFGQQISSFTDNLPPDPASNTEIDNIVTEVQDILHTYIVSPGSIQSNSLVTVDVANLYFQTQLNSDAWDCASPTDKAKAVISATRLMNNLAYIGVKVYPNQFNEFPRRITKFDFQILPQQIRVPDAIRIACCEIALSLLDGVDLEFAIPGIAVQDDRYSNLRTSYKLNIIDEHVRAGIPSATAWLYIKPYLADPGAINLGRVS